MALSFPHSIQFVDAGIALPASLTAEQIENPSTIPDSETAKGQFKIGFNHNRLPFPNDPNDDTTQLVKMLGWTVQPAMIIPAMVSTFQAELTASADYSNRVKIVASRKSYNRMANYFRGLRDFAVEHLGTILIHVPGTGDLSFISPIDDENVEIRLEAMGAVPENGYIRNRQTVMNDVQVFDSADHIKRGIRIPTPLKLVDRLLDPDNVTFLCESTTEEL